MTRPHLIINASISDTEKIVHQALLYVEGKKPKVLSNDMVCQILNRFDNSICQPLDENKFLIDDVMVVRKLLSSQVKHDNKYKGIALASGALIVGLLSIMNIGDKDDDMILGNERAVGHSLDAITQDIEIPYALSNTVINFDDIILNQNKVNDKFAIIDDVALQMTAPTFLYSYEDRSDHDKINYAIANYYESIAKYSKTYGLDEKLVSAIIAQENAYNSRNNSNVGARGVTQVESIWWGEELKAYNFDLQDYETVIVDGARLNDDSDYAIKIGCMIVNQYYHNLRNTFIENQILTPDECLIATLTGYNKGITGLRKIIRNYGNDYINHRDAINGGDNLYAEHVLSFLENGTNITFLNQDLSRTSVNIENTEARTMQK